jgi:hypothetical protein
MTSLLTLLFLLFCFQDLDTVTIYGKVVDQNGAVIPGAAIKVQLRSATTDEQGRTD